MSAPGFTPIQLYYSTTASAAPSSGNLANGELAINITDGKLYYKDNGGTVRVLAGTGGTGVVAGSNTQVQFNNNGVFGASANMTFNGTRLTVADLADSGLTSGRVVYASTGGALVDSANLTFDGTNLTLGGGTANGVAYLNGSKVLTTGSALTFDGTTLTNTRNTTDGTSAALTLNNSGATGSYATLNLNAGSVTYQQFADAAGNAIGSAGVMFRTTSNHPLVWGVNNAEQMRLTSTGLGIGTSSFSLTQLQVKQNTTYAFGINNSNDTQNYSWRIDSGASNALVLGTRTTSTDLLWLSAAGNLGLGVTPSAWISTFKALQIGSRASFYSDSGASTLIGNNTYNDGQNRYIANAAAALYLQFSGAHQWYTAPSGTAGNAISFTQAMTLEGTDRTNLLLGKTSATFNSANRGLFELNGTTDSLVGLFVNGAARGYIHANPNGVDILANNSYSLNFYSGGAYAGKFDSSGNLLVKKTSDDLTTPGFCASIQSSTFNGLSIIKGGGTWGTNLFVGRTSTAGTGAYSEFWYNGTTTGTITTNGTSTTYNTSSDYRLKENIQPMQNALGVVAQLNPVTYNWKADGSDGQGFIAHELQAVVPDCVTGEKDAVDAEGKPVYQGIDTSFLVATLTAAIQEQQAIINAQQAALETLTARVASLESK